MHVCSMRLGTRLCVLGLLCLQNWALGLGQIQDQTLGEKVQSLAFCNDPQVKEAVGEALKKFNSGMLHGHKMALYQVLQATKVMNDSGTMIFALFTSKRSNCPAGGDKPWNECDYHPDGPKTPTPCNTTVYVTEAERLVQTVFCEIEPPVKSEHTFCLGCPKDIDGMAEELKVPLTFALNKFNSNSNSTHLFVVNSVADATRQVISGLRYRFMFDMWKSNCSKAEFKEMHPSCQKHPDEVELAHCSSTVDVAPWRHELPEANVDCMEGPMPPTTFSRRRPPGWSPLRNVVDFQVEGTVAPNTSTTPAASAKEESSEESQEKTSSHTSVLVHCPSKPWKEDVPPAVSTPAETTVTDLPALEDPFSDADLLG